MKNSDDFVPIHGTMPYLLFLTYSTILFYTELFCNQFIILHKYGIAISAFPIADTKN